MGHSLPGAAVVSRGNLLGRVHSLADIFAVKPLWDMTATIDGRAEAVSSEMISGNYYSTLGVQPALGRAAVAPFVWTGFSGFKWKDCSVVVVAVGM